jgi:hypothetical protein
LVPRSPAALQALTPPIGTQVQSAAQLWYIARSQLSLHTIVLMSKPSRPSAQFLDAIVLHLQSLVSQYWPALQSPSPFAHMSAPLAALYPL